MPRLFIALPITPTPALRELLDSLAGLADRSLIVPGMPRGGRIKPVTAERLHLTLRFLDEVPEARVPSLVRAVDDAARAAHTGPFEIELRGLGQYPPLRERAAPRARARKPPRVIFVDLERIEPVRALAAALDRSLNLLDDPIPPEKRPLDPHLTVARIVVPGGGWRHAAHVLRGSGAASLEEALAPYAERDFGRVSIDALHLVASQLHPKGPIYTTLHRAEF